MSIYKVFVLFSRSAQFYSCQARRKTGERELSPFGRRATPIHYKQAWTRDFGRQGPKSGVKVMNLYQCLAKTATFFVPLMGQFHQPQQ